MVNTSKYSRELNFEQEHIIMSDCFLRYEILQDDICPCRPLCSCHLALKIITLAHLYPELWTN